MPEFEIRTCRAGLCGEGAGVLEPVAMPAGLTPLWQSVPVRIIELPAPPRDPAVAAHEAGHAICYHAAGRRMTSVRIDLPACVKLAPSDAPRARSAALLAVMAGPVAQLRFHRVSYRSPDEELAPYVEAVKNFEMGGCDRCRTLTFVASEIGIDAPASTYFARYRAEEERAEIFVRRPNVWSAIRDLADYLMSEGVVTGDRAHEIAERHIAFGSLNSGE